MINGECSGNVVELVVCFPVTCFLAGGDLTPQQTRLYEASSYVAIKLDLQGTLQAGQVHGLIEPDDTKLVQP